MKSFVDYFFENYTSSIHKKDVLDDVTDEKIGEQEYQKFDVKFDDGARAYGTVKDGIANIIQINSPKLDTITPLRGTKTYQRVLKLLSKNGINTVNIKLQSSDSRAAIQKLLQSQILINPRGTSGISVDQYPTIFDINPSKLMLEYRHNLADGTPAPSIQAHNGKNPNSINKKKLHTVGPYKPKQMAAHRPGQILAGAMLDGFLADYNLEFKPGEVSKIKNSPHAIQMYVNPQTRIPTGRIIVQN